MTWDWREHPALVAASAAALGVLVTVLLAWSVWPQAEPGSAQAANAPTVPPPPSQTDILSDQTPSPSQTESDDEIEESGSDPGDEPEDAPPIAEASPAGQGDLPDATPVTCPGPTATVSSGSDLEDALEDAQPGDSILLADGTYAGNFETTASGTADQPIFLCGTAAAVIDGGDIEGDYSLYLDRAAYWRLVGFTVSGGQKGVVADGTVGSVIQELTVSGTGDEAIHLRSDSTDNVVLANTISDTGNRNDKYGEGVYLGSAVSNWCTYTDCRADRSDRNVVKDNVISGTSSESIDIKEGTTGGLVVGNTFDGGGMTGADSWLDVKGNNYLVEGNTGTNSGTTAVENGMQTHQILDGWGDLNVFTDNSLDVTTSDYAITAWPEESNVVGCDNTFVGAAEGLSNVPCT